MINWQIIPKIHKVDGVKFRLSGVNTLSVYIGLKLRKQIKGYRPDGWCDIYSRGDSLMIQLVSKPDKNSRKVGHHLFSLPYSVVSKHWQNGTREKDIPAMVEKGSLILLDLKDLAR